MDLHDIKTTIVAVLTSGGGQATEQQLLRDYKNLIGDPIPFRSHGFSTLRLFLESLGGFFITRNNFGDLIINQGFDEKTAHISSLISRQKKKPGSGKGKRRTSFTSAYGRPPYSGPSHSRPSQLRAYQPRSRIPPRQPLVTRQPLETRQPVATPIPQLMAAPIRQHYANPPIIPQRQPLPSPPRSNPQEPPIPKTTTSTVSCPPIIPQRLPSSSVQRRLERKSDSTAPSLNVPAAHSKILSVNSGTNGSMEISDTKEQSNFEEPSEDANFIDIQWLQGKIRTNNVVRQRVAITVPLETPGVVPESVEKAAPPSSVVKFKSYVTELFKLAEEHKMGSPEYKIIQCPKSGHLRQERFLAKVKIGHNFHVNSFPDEKATSEEAQELVAKMACDELLRRLNPHLPLESSTPIVDRVFEIVEKKSNGMFDEAVVAEYERIHKSRLPTEWLKFVSLSPRFSLENLAGKFIIYPAASEEIYHVNGTTNGMSSPTSETSIDIDINANKVVKPEACHRLRELPKLVTPQSSNWDVYVASVSSNDVWIRFVGEEYDVKYNNIMNNLEMKLLSHCVQASDVIIDEFYVAKFDNCWLRVQLKETEDGVDECVVFLIDNGEIDTIPLTELYVLDDEFLHLPPQAVRCRLSFVDVRIDEAQSYVLSNVIGSCFVADVLVPPSENNFASIVLYNTELEGKPINVNFNILNEIIKSLKVPQLPLRTVSTLRLTHVEKECLPWVQMEGTDLDLLELVLDDLSHIDVLNIHGVNAHPIIDHKDKMVLVKSGQLKTWRRGVIVNSKDAKSPLVRLVDYGYEEKCMWSDIFDMVKVLPGLQNFPPQAFQIKIDNLSASQLVEGVVRRLKELVPEGVQLLAKVKNDETKAVELFRRFQPDNLIVSINADLTFNLDEYSKNSEPEVRKLNGNEALVHRGSTTPLKQYEVPASDFFDISVTISSNPSNFIVQPYNEINLFNTLMEEMQSFYEARLNIMLPPAAQDLVKNATFAAKREEDSQWYRVSIVTALNTSTVSVRYSDFGDVGILPVDSIRYLEQRFRSLPSLAICAKLFGVKPKNSDWSVEECIYFNSLVQDKSFVSRIMVVSTENDACKVALELYETSGDTDINIGSHMIEKGMAEAS